MMFTILTLEANIHYQRPAKRGRISKKTKDRLRGVSEAVLFTTETLENILQHLPSRQLLLMQRVCRKFRNVITGNKSLQQKLFLLPSKVQFCWNYSTRKWGKEFNVPISKGDCDGSTGSTEDVSRNHLRAEPSYVFLNPMLLKLRKGSYLMTRDGSADIGHDAELIRPSSLLRDYPEASWRRMYLTQPPLNSIDVWFALGDSDRSVNGNIGLKFRGIIEYARKLEKRFHERMQGWLFMFHAKEELISEHNETAGLRIESESEDEWSN